ncbi:MAG: zinc ribbon domain-containing protein [Candidatus Peribacteraceae bacterium]|nr:zinc ribbon domain-containing protein [Candidatus Peribacteraceae bacterium]
MPPTYDYQCHGCEHIFEKTRKMADRKQPEDDPCPKCGSNGGVKHMLTPIPLNYDGCHTNFRIPGEFKDKLIEVKKFAGKTSTIEY